MISKYKKQIFSLIILLSLFCFSAYPILAVEIASNITDATGNLTIFGGSAGYDAAKSDINVYIGNIIKYFLSFLGVVFLILIIYGGYTWMQARGDTEAIQKSKDTIINAGIGLAITLGAYLITNYIVLNLISTTLKT